MSVRAAKDLGALRVVLDAAREELKCSRDALTVLAVRRDPYRLESDANRTDAQWLASQIESVFTPQHRVHIRGLHYALFAKGDVRKPNGETYSNSDDDYVWLGTTVKSARWLGVLPFDRISDNRNTEPTICRTNEPIYPVAGYVSAAAMWLGASGAGNINFLKPWPSLLSFARAQPFALSIFGEKSSLEEVLAPIARHCEADLYLGAGEISDTLAYRMAKDGAEDGRPMVVFTVTDFDPAGFQMPISIGRKLQALRDLCFPGLQFEVVPVALTVDQVRRLDLPSTPLKETERRADKWREEFGVEQTEIDALATLRPQVLREIVEEALKPYFDSTLARRIAEAKDQWGQQAQEVIDGHVDADELVNIQGEAEDIEVESAERVEAINTEMAERADALDKRLREMVAGIKLPKPVLPEIRLAERLPHAVIISSEWGWVEGTRALKARKTYGGEGET
jgi:hypothetical protein